MTSLTVQTGAFGASPQAEIRDWELKLLKRVDIGEPLDVAPGRYVVSVARPGAEDAVEVVLLEEGEEATVTLGEAPEETLAAAEDADEALVAANGGGGLPPGGPVLALPWQIRLVSGRDGEAVTGSVTPRVTVSGDSMLEVDVLDMADEPRFAQLAVPRAIPHNVALPERWTLRISLVEGDLAARAVPPPDGYVADVAAYLQAGQISEAADLGATAERLLRQKMANPIGATIGAYALLRMGRIELMHDWPYNLSEWFGWLPDGAVIAAELAFLENRRKEATAQLERAAERGVPLFADGLSLLSRRVREGLVKTKPARRVAALAAFAELGHLTVVLRGVDPTAPADTQTPLTDFPASGGWHAFTGAQEA